MGRLGDQRDRGVAEGRGWMLQCSREGLSGNNSAVEVSANFLALHPGCSVQVQPQDSFLPPPAAEGAGVSGGCKC